MYFDVTEATYSGKYQIDIRFADGSSGKVDFAKYLEEGTVLGKLRDLATFKNFGVKYGTIVWGEDLDIAPETLYFEATGKDVTYQNRSNVVS
jgi:hypothetical protein